MKKRNLFYFFMILPSLLGILVFYCIPFFLSASYTLINNMAEKKFVGLENFRNMITDELFLRAVRNTFSFILLSVPISMLLSLLLAMALFEMKKGRSISCIFLFFPIIVPSGTIVYFWKILFDVNGVVNKWLSESGLPVGNLGHGKFAMAVIILLFLWKNISYNIVLFWSGLNWIPQIYYQQYELEGASAYRMFRDITLVFLSPTSFTVLLMSIVNSFKVFKEIYQLYGAYPTPDIYMLQHYMNNQFSALNMQKLCTAAYLLFLFVSIVLLIIFYLQKKLTDTYQ